MAACHAHGGRVAGVGKVACAHPAVVSALVAGGVDELADSRIMNLVEMGERGTGLRQMLLPVSYTHLDVYKRQFVDSGKYPDRNGDGIARDGAGGVGAGTIIERDADYWAPVCDHFGQSTPPADLLARVDPVTVRDVRKGCHGTKSAGDERSVDPLAPGSRGLGLGPDGDDKPCAAIGRCTLCDPDKIVYIDELDATDSAPARLEATRAYRSGELIRPEVEWAGDGTINVQLFVPQPADVAEAYAVAMAARLGLDDPVVINLEVMHQAEGCFVEVLSLIHI